MRFSDSLLVLVLATRALAAPLVDLAGLAAREEEADSMDVDWSQFGDTPVVPLEPVADSNATLAKRKEKFDLKDQITLAWKNGT
jgi:hypothetical protein